MNSTKEILEALSALIEDELPEEEFIDDFEDTEISTEDSMLHSDNVTDTLDAKTTISRALDVLKDAINNFKTSTAEAINLITDTEVTQSYEALDEIVNNLTNYLVGSKDEQNPAELEEVPEKDLPNSEENSEEVNFDDQAELNLFDDDKE